MGEGEKGRIVFTGMVNGSICAIKESVKRRQEKTRWEKSIC